MAQPAPVIFGSHAQALADLGYAPLPLDGKRPIYNDWQHYNSEHLDNIIAARPSANVGINCRGLSAVDADIYDPHVAGHMGKFLRKLLGQNQLMFRIGQKPKWLCLLRCAEGGSPKRSSALYEDSQGRQHRIEVLGDGQQFLAIGAHPDTGRAVTWPWGSPLDHNLPADHLVPITAEQVDRLIAEFERIAERQGWRLVSRGKTAAAEDAPVAAPVAGLTLDLAGEVLEHYPNDELHYDEWLAVGMALHHQFQGDPLAFAVWNAWSDTASKAGDTPYNWHRWQSFDHTRPGGISMRSILVQAEHNGWVRPSSVEGAPAAADDFPQLDSPAPAEPAPAEAPTVSLAQQADTADSFQPLDAPAPGPPAPAPAAPDPGAILPGIYRIDPSLVASTLPKRDWIIPGRLIAGHVALLVGPPGVSKSMFDLTWAVSIITGRNLLGMAPMRSGPVIVINNEDPREEIDKRVVSICAQYRIPLSEVVGDLHIYSGYEKAIKMAEMVERQGALRPTKDATRVVHFAQAIGAVTIIADTLISTVRGGEENSNDRMEELVGVYKSIASKTGCAISITHHTRKGGADTEAHAGNMEAARGAGALIGSVRNAHTLAGMSEATGTRLGLPREVSKLLVRLDSAKQNYWVPDGKASWFKLTSTPVGNGEDTGVPVPVDIDQIVEQYSDQAASAEVVGNDAHRGLLTQLFVRDLDEQGLWSGSLRAMAERWMAAANLSERQAQEQCKRLIPEGGSDQAVDVNLNGTTYRLWRTLVGEGRGARHAVYMKRDDSGDNGDWMS